MTKLSDPQNERHLYFQISSVSTTYVSKAEELSRTEFLE